MSSAAELSARYAPELKGFGASLPDDLALGLSRLAGRYDEAQLEQWSQAGIALANHSLRSWEATSEYFRASPDVAERLTFEELQHWVELASELASESSLMAAAFLKATPAALKQLTAVELDDWSAQGGRLCRGNWKSIALSGLYFQHSPRLLGSLPLASVGRLVDVIDQLTERSYELANSVLESAGEIFENLAEGDREAFLSFARAVTRASWADTRLYFERGPKLLDGVEASQRSTFLELASKVTMDVGRQGFPLFADAAQSLTQIEPEDHGELLAFATAVAPGSSTAAMEYLKSAPFVRSRLTPQQMERWAEVGVELLNMGNAEGAGGSDGAGCSPCCGVVRGGFGTVVNCSDTVTHMKR